MKFKIPILHELLAEAGLAGEIISKLSDAAQNIDNSEFILTTEDLKLLENDYIMTEIEEAWEKAEKLHSWICRTWHAVYEEGEEPLPPRFEGME